MKICGERLRALRESMHLSQMKIAKMFGIGQSAVVRYVKSEAEPPFELLLRMADFYDVSMDYLFGRTDNPQGKLYECKPKKGYSPEMASTLWATMWIAPCLQKQITVQTSNG